MSQFPQRVALVGFGEVGQILADDLGARRSIEINVWDRLFEVSDSLPSAAARSRPALRAARSLADAVAGCGLVISAVTAAQGLGAATEAAGSLAPGSYYLDLNSVSPNTKRQAALIIQGAGGLYVEAAVMSAIGFKRSASPVLLGGANAAAFLPLAQALGFSGCTVFSEVLGRASAVKMCRSVVIKGMEALLTESLLSARHYGVEDAVLSSFNDLLPAANWPMLARYMISRSLQHGRRRAEEMQEVARTVRDAGLNPWMSLGCIERQAWAADRDRVAEHTQLDELLDAIRQGSPAGPLVENVAAGAA
ncbi:MAG: NAD(P)-dependent oxidoreductase [Proteobacteria bacterium]|nr:NAD(P)-dependent oxidoreductase [Pseudomonadota bacterium]